MSKYVPPSSFLIEAYAAMAGVPFRADLAVLGGAVARLYDDLLDEYGSEDLAGRLSAGHRHHGPAGVQGEGSDRSAVWDCPGQRPRVGRVCERPQPDGFVHAAGGEQVGLHCGRQDRSGVAGEGGPCGLDGDSVFVEAYK
ncbi:hypothetical protein H4W30_004809 [Amycolatopsis roodepoortensis]|uniref:Uncharacterized protein n=1 Tax=Amycolatopsis roodepoortensis TaxID=700274 RepID=A0ABR9LAP1_9PSEU|nr:hypothetical protein [Amycolatopsis roodepoortensis]MBE1577749.1 hypothetical protein [Amycolatopsis roodepoortensis]